MLVMDSGVIYMLINDFSSSLRHIQSDRQLDKS